MSQKNQFVPTLRFSEFDKKWKIIPVSKLLKRVANSVNVCPKEMYREIGIRSHGKGVFHKAPVSGKDLGNKRVFHVVSGTLAFNIVFAWEHAVAELSKKEEGFIASHRFPMYKSVEGLGDIPFLRILFLRPRGKYLLGLASPGGAGRNKTLGQKEFSELKVTVPQVEEQKKIAAFLGTIDKKIEQLQAKKYLLESYKDGCMQKLFSQELRFTSDNGASFPDWENYEIDKVFKHYKGYGLSKGAIAEEGQYPCVLYGELYTTYPEKISQIQSYTNEDSGTKSQKGDLLVPSSTTTSGIDLANITVLPIENVRIGGDITIMRPKKSLNELFYAYYLTHYKKHEIAKYAQGITIVHLYFNHFKKIKIDYPHPDEQKKIANFLSAIDDKISVVAEELNKAKTFKKGLLQKMFV